MVVDRSAFSGDARARGGGRGGVRNAAEIAFAPTTIRIAPPGTGHDEPPVDCDMRSLRTTLSKMVGPGRPASIRRQ